MGQTLAIRVLFVFFFLFFFYMAVLGPVDWDGRCLSPGCGAEGTVPDGSPSMPLLPLLLFICFCGGESPAQGPPVVFVYVSWL